MFGSLINSSTGMPALDAREDFARARRAAFVARAARSLTRRHPHHPRTLRTTAGRPAHAARLEVIPLESIVGTVEPSPHFDARYMIDGRHRVSVALAASGRDIDAWVS